MSFGKSPDDYRELAGAAHATLLNARKACGDGDALTLNISSLGHVLTRLSAGVELSEKEGGVRKRDGDNRWRELATLARECARLLKVLNQVLGKYNSLSTEKKKVTKLWRRVKFGNGEILDLDKLQREMGAYTQAITIFLGSVERGPVGEVEGYMDTHGAELREVKHTLHWVIAKMLALEEGEEEGVLKQWRTGMEARSLVEVVKEKLANEGWAPKVLARHQKTIARYIAELGERGVLDGTELVLNGGRGNSSSSLNKSSIKDPGDLGQYSESDSDSESSLDEEDGTEMPLGRRRSSTVSAEKRPDIHEIVPTGKRSLNEIETSEDESGDESSHVGSPSLDVSKSNAQYLTPLKKSTTHVVQEQHNTSNTKHTDIRFEGPAVSNTAAMALSISNLPPLPISRPRSRTSNIAAEGSGQPIFATTNAIHIPTPHSTRASPVQSSRASVEIFPSQTLSISSLPQLPISRPRSRKSDHNVTASSTQLLPNQADTAKQYSGDPTICSPATTSNVLAHAYQNIDNTSDEYSDSEDELRHHQGNGDVAEGILAPTASAIPYESSIARPQLQQPTKPSCSNLVSPLKQESTIPNLEQTIVDCGISIIGTDQRNQSLFVARDASQAPLTGGSPPSLTVSLLPTESHLDDSSGDESEQSYLVIEGASSSQISYDDGPDCSPADISQTESMENIVPQSSHQPEESGDTNMESVIAGAGSDVSTSDVDGHGYMNAWSVILSHVSDDHESTLLETSDVWAQNNPAIHLALSQKVTKDSPHHVQSRSDTPGSSPTNETHGQSQTRSRNVTLVGDSDDEPRPPKTSELWPEGAPEALLSVNTSTLESLNQRMHDKESYASGTDESVTVPGDSDNEPFSPTKSVTILASSVVPQGVKHTVLTQNLTLESEYESSDNGVVDQERKIPTSRSKSPTHDVQHSRTVPNIQFRINTDPSLGPVSFREMDYQPEQQPLKHKDNKTSDLGPRGEDKHMSSRRNRNGSKGKQSAANLADESWIKEVERRMEEYQVQGHSKPGKEKGPAMNTASSPASSGLHVSRQISNFGGSNRSWWWSSNKAARAQYQPTIEDINDEDSLPGAHPNCWSNESEEFSQVGSDPKSGTDTSSSMQNGPKPRFQQYLNPFRTNSTLKTFQVWPSDTQCFPDDGNAVHGFPSSDDNEEVRKYRSGKQIVYEDPDLSFNSALDESSDADDESQNGAQRKQVEATTEQKEAFKKGIKADRYRKKRYRLENGKEAVWGSASEREELRKVRTLRKKGIDLPRITGGRKTVTFEIDGKHETPPITQRPEQTDAKLKEMCRAYIEDIRDEDFLPGAHPNCETPTGSTETGEVFSQHDLESSVSIIDQMLKVRPTSTSVSPSKSAPSSRQSKAKRPRNPLLLPLPDDDKDEDLRRYRREETAAPPQEDSAPAWRSTRAYRNKKNKQRRFSHGEDEKFWDEPSSWGAEAAGSSEDDWGETYRSNNSRNSSIVGMGGCTCCVVEAQPKRRRQHYRSPPVIHHPELNPINPFLPAENKNTTVAAIQPPSQQSRRRSSIDPWSPDPPSVRRHRREKTSESPTYHVPDAPAPVLNSARPELPTRRRTENTESPPQAPRPDLARRRTDAADSLPQAPRPETGRRTIRTAVREHSPKNLKSEQPRRRIENGEDSIQATRVDIGRRLSVRKSSPTRPDLVKRRTDVAESAPHSQHTRPDINRRRAGERELSPLEIRPDMPRRMTVDKEHKPREKLLRFDIK